MDADYQPVFVRAYTERVKEDSKRSESPGRKSSAWPREVLVFDCETTIDPSQRLLFGAYRYNRMRTDGRLRCVEEGIFHADDLDREQLATIRSYVKANRAAAPSRRLRCYSLDGFLRRVLYRAIHRAGAVSVGFNLPFDFSRLAWDWVDPTRKRFVGGFSLRLWHYEDMQGIRRRSQFRPDLSIKAIDSKRQFMGFTIPKQVEGEPEGSAAGPLLDCARSRSR